MKQGDYVTRKSYGSDVVFRIEQINGHIVILRGVEYRLIADAPMSDLEQTSDPFLEGAQEETKTRYQHTMERLQRFRQTVMERTRDNLNQFISPEGWGVGQDQYFEVPGKVLHLDGDSGYLHKSMEMYGKLRVPAEGHHIQEAHMPEALFRLLPRVRPNIIVITGHDGMVKAKDEMRGYVLDNYKNSGNFVEAVKTARQYERNMDALIIIAGACQSHFEALLQAGANFASSPGRILIHALDPVQIASKASYTSMKDTIQMQDMIEHTMSGLKGMGGIETRGCFRIGMPSLRTK